jgi:hypothetical protein
LVGGWADGWLFINQCQCKVVLLTVNEWETGTGAGSGLAQIGQKTHSGFLGVCLHGYLLIWHTRKMEKSLGVVSLAPSASFMFSLTQSVSPSTLFGFCLLFIRRASIIHDTHGIASLGAQTQRRTSKVQRTLLQDLTMLYTSKESVTLVHPLHLRCSSTLGDITSTALPIIFTALPIISSHTIIPSQQQAQTINHHHSHSCYFKPSTIHPSLVDVGYFTIKKRHATQPHSLTTSP